MDADTANLFLGAGLNLLVALLIARFIYYPVTQDKHDVFSFLAFNTVIYFVMSVLTSVEFGIGVGFGLFAVFSVLRYRTAEMPIREMTYLFVVMALPVKRAEIGKIDFLRDSAEVTIYYDEPARAARSAHKPARARQLQPWQTLER